MKALLAFACLAASLVLTGCEAYVVDHHPAAYRTYSHRPYYYRPSVVAYHDDDRYYGDRYYGNRYYGNRYYGAPYRTRTVSHYAAPTRIVYYNDNRGRYYVNSGRRVYVTVR